MNSVVKGFGRGLKETVNPTGSERPFSLRTRSFPGLARTAGWGALGALSLAIVNRDPSHLIIGLPQLAEHIGNPEVAAFAGGAAARLQKNAFFYAIGQAMRGQGWRQFKPILRQSIQNAPIEERAKVLARLQAMENEPGVKLSNRSRKTLAELRELMGPVIPSENVIDVSAVDEVEES